MSDDRAAQEIRERDECIQEQQALLDRCAEVLEHALANVKALTGGDERRMRQLLSALRKEDNARDLLLDENAELRRKLAAWEEKAKEWLLSPEAAKRLDGYRELGEKCAQLEDQNEALRLRNEVLENEAALSFAALKAREGPVPGLAEEGPYSLADVELIEKARGKPYARLRATVLERDRLRDSKG